MRKIFFPAMTPIRRAVVWATLSLSVACGAHALTLTRPLVQSQLGEPLRVEIDFADISSDELQGLQARMADGSAYSAMRLETPSVPLQVELLQRPNGRPYVRLSSLQALSQKTLDVLLLLRWANGQLLRDFSISLESVPTTANATPAPAALRPVPDSAAPSPTAPPAPATAPPASTETRVSVKSGDTASALVAPLRPASVSLDQMLLALLRQNPDAFIQNNVHRLKAGSLLEVPSAEQAKAVPAAQAREEMLLQTEDFNSYRAELATWAGRGELPEAQRQSSGSVSARVRTPGQGTKDQLTLTRPQDARAQEELARQKEAQQVAQRAAELGRNVSELQRLAAQAAITSGDGPNLPVPEQGPSWLDDWSQNPLTPVAAGALIALLVLAGLWRQRRPALETAAPLTVDFDLDLPDLPLVSAPPHAHENSASTEVITQRAPEAGRVTTNDHTRATVTVPHPTLGIPDVSLDLDPSSPHPLDVRLQLAQELWDLGQHHTSRALVEEIVTEARGELQERARQWLAQRS